MLIQSNFHSEDKIYNTNTDGSKIKLLVDKIIANDSSTVFSTGTLIKKREVVKFRDGSWFEKGKLITFSDKKSKIIEKIQELNISTVKEDEVAIENNIGKIKKYSVSDEFEKIINILDFLGELEVCNIYEVIGVRIDNREVLEKVFFEGEEIDLIKWATGNKLWHYLKEVAD